MQIDIPKTNRIHSQHFNLHIFDLVTFFTYIQAQSLLIIILFIEGIGLKFKMLFYNNLPNYHPGHLPFLIFIAFGAEQTRLTFTIYFVWLKLRPLINDNETKVVNYQKRKIKQPLNDDAISQYSQSMAFLAIPAGTRDRLQRPGQKHEHRQQRRAGRRRPPETEQ